MTSPFSDDILSRAAAGDCNALTQLDACGLFPAPSESSEDFVKRLRSFSKTLHTLNQTLDSNGKADLKQIADLDGLTVSDQQRIPTSLFAHIAQRNQALYKFTIDWVPGFYIHSPFSLFGGAAFCSFPDPFFTMFIVRDSFENNEKWLIYKRNELIAHELCHVARISLLSNVFEETFAYQTADSSFRKRFGGIFYRQMDSLLFLASTFLLLIGQLIKTFFLPSLPIWPFWSIIALDFLWLNCRLLVHSRQLMLAKQTIQQLFGSDYAWAVLFRLTDGEIRRFASSSHDDARSWILAQQSSLRWKIILNRFPLLP